MRHKLGGWLLVGVACGCASNTKAALPDAVPHTGAAMPSEGDRLVGAGDVVRFELQTRLDRSVRLATSARRDLLMRTSEPGALAAVRSNVQVSGMWCREEEAFVLSNVQPGETVVLRTSKPAQVEVLPLPPPRAVELAVATPVDLLPVAQPDDPRGAIAEATLSLTAAAEVEIDMHPHHVGPTHVGEHLPNYRLFGPAGPASPRVMGQVDGEPGRRIHRWELAKGTYHLRVRPEGPCDRSISCDPGIDGFEPPAWCAVEPDGETHPVRVTLRSIDPTAPPEAKPADAVAADHTLRDRPLSLSLRQPPERAERSVRVIPGIDVAVRWQPRDASFVTLRWGEPEARGWTFCHDWPCIKPIVDFEAFDVLVSNTRKPTTVDVEVIGLAPPEPVAEVTLDATTSVRVAPVAPADPRAAMADIVVAVAEAGTYVVDVTREGDGDVPNLIDFAPWGGTLRPHARNMLGPANYNGIILMPDRGGRYLVRIGGEGRVATPFEVEVGLRRLPEP